MYLNAQDFESELKLVNENIEFVITKIAESKIKSTLEKDRSYAPAYVSLSKISLMKVDKNTSIKNANLVDRFDTDFRPLWEVLNSLRKKIQMGASKYFQNALDLYPYYHKA